MVWELLQGCINPLYMTESLLCGLTLHDDRLTHHFTAMAGPVFAVGTKILNIEDVHSKHTFKLGGGYWPKVKQCSKQSGLVTVLQDLV